MPPKWPTARIETPALLKSLRQTMRDDLRTLVAEVPLKMAGKPRAIVINTNQKRRLPAALRQNLARSLVPIPME